MILECELSIKLHAKINGVLVLFNLCVVDLQSDWFFFNLAAFGKDGVYCFRFTNFQFPFNTVLF